MTRADQMRCFYTAALALPASSDAQAVAAALLVKRFVGRETGFLDGGEA